MKSLLILGTAAVLSSALNVAGAQQAATGATASGGTDITEVIITGTRRLDRTVTESSAPIDVLTGAELSAHPASNMLDVLSDMVPSFIVGQNSISDASSFVRSPSLRGLPADEMLVMLNGKRFNRSALVQVYQGGETELAFGSQGPDLASIPAISVKSLEILRDGASAQYGSDAIAGVLNYQFRTNASGLELEGTYGRYYPGNGYKDDGDAGTIAANLGLPLAGDQGFANLSLEFSQNQQTVRNPTRPSALEFAQAFPALAPGLPHYPGPVQQWGTPPSTAYKAVLNSGVNLNNGDKVYFFANYGHIDTDESFNFRLPVSFTGASGAKYSHHPAFNPVYLDPCTSANTGCPTGGFINDANQWSLTSVYPSGYTPRFYGTTQEVFGTVGDKGTTSSGMTYDVSGTMARNSLDLSLRSSVNPSLGNLSPTGFYIGKFVQQETNFNLDVTYPWKLEMLSNPVNVGAGLEWRNENYQQVLGDVASYAAGPYTSQPLYDCVGTVCTPTPDPSSTTGGQLVVTHSTASNGFGGISTSVDVGQRSYAAYVDLETDVTSQLTLGVAGRYEDYTSFGSTTLGKFQIRFKVNDALALRGTVSSGFHAPTPGQSNVETLSTTFIPGTTTQVQIGTYRVTSAAAKHYGAVPLHPEESTNYSAGFVLTPMPGLLVTVDGYQIAVRNRIGISQQFTVTQNDINQQPALAYVGLGGTVQYFTNGFDTTTKGIDVVATYPFHLGNAGRLDTTLAYNYNKTSVDSYNPTVINQTRIIDIEHYAPNDRVNLTFDWTKDKIGVALHQNYYGSYRDENDYPGQTFSSSWTTDLEFSYKVTHSITAAIGGRNIFNALPDVVCSSSATPANCGMVNPLTGGLGDGERYPRTGGPYGYNGAFFYARVGAKF